LFFGFTTSSFKDEVKVWDFELHFQIIRLKIGILNLIFKSSGPKFESLISFSNLQVNVLIFEPDSEIFRLKVSIFDFIFKLSG